MKKENRERFAVSKILRNLTMGVALGVVALSLVPCQGFAADGGVSSTQTTTKQKLPDIHQSGPAKTFTLENGLQVVVIEDHRAPVVTQMVWYKAGSADEPKGRTGIAHFLEHLMFKGTKIHPEGEFSKFISKIGGEENAFTSYDYTAYYQSVATQYLPQIMAFEADRMTNLVLTDKVIVPERNVIIEERRMRTDNSPDAMLDEEARATLFLNHPYHNPVIGWKQEMEQLNRDDAITFYSKFYTPNNAILVVSGDVTAEQVRELAMTTYGPIAVRANPGERMRPQEPVSRTSRLVTMRDPRVSEPSFQQMWVVPSYHNGNRDTHEAAALDLLGEILGGSNRSRLYQKLVVDKGIAASVQAGYGGDAVDDGVFYLYGMPRGGASLDELHQAVLAELHDIIYKGVSEKELDQARNRFVKSMIFSADNPSGLARIYGAALSVGMTVDDVTKWADRLNAVTTADIKHVAGKYLKADTGVTSFLLPPSQDKPAVGPSEKKGK